MKQILREYGPITTLLVCSVLGYLWYDVHREDVLAYSLDAVGQRLVEMVDDVSARATVAQAFGRFKERVLGGEIAPEDVEAVAANVFNLQQQSARLTPEQAELVLQSAYVAAAESTDVARSFPSPAERIRVTMRPPHAAVPLASGERVELGERLSSLVAFQESIADLPRGDQREMVARHIHIVAQQGLRVKIDADLADALPAEVYEQVVAAVAKLERRQMVVWDPHLAATLRSEREQAAREVARLAQVVPHEQRDSVLAMLEALRQLEVMGYRSAQDLAQDDAQTVVLPWLEEVDSLAVQGAVHGLVEQALEQAAVEVEAAVEAAAQAAQKAEGNGRS